MLGIVENPMIKLILHEAFFIGISYKQSEPIFRLLKQGLHELFTNGGI